MAKSLSAKWTWADAGLFHHGLAKRVPLHALAKRIPLLWSSLQSVEDTLADLATYQFSSPDRPIKVCLCCSSPVAGAEELREANVELQREFLDMGWARAGLQEYLPASRSVSNCAAEGEPGEDVNVLLKSFYSQVSDPIRVIVRWSWNANQLWRAKWCDLKEAQTMLEECRMDSRRITLQIKVSLRDLTKVRYNTELGTVAAAAALLHEVLNVSTKKVPDASSSHGVRGVSAAPYSPTAGIMPSVSVSSIDPPTPIHDYVLPPNETGCYLLAPDATGYMEEGADPKGLGREMPSEMGDYEVDLSGLRKPPYLSMLPHPSTATTATMPRVAASGMESPAMHKNVLPANEAGCYSLAQDVVEYTAEAAHLMPKTPTWIQAGAPYGYTFVFPDQLAASPTNNTSYVLPPNETGCYLLAPDAMGYMEEGAALQGLGHETPKWIQAQALNSSTVVFPEIDSPHSGNTNTAGELAAAPTMGTSEMDDYVMDLRSFCSSPLSAK